MDFPYLQMTKSPTESRVMEFRGYDVQNVIEDGSMRDMKNLTTDEYPCLYPRKKRGDYSDIYVGTTAILARRGKLAVCDRTSFWYDGERKFDFDLDYEGERQMQAINTRIVIWPDKVWFNTDTGEHGDLGHVVKCTSVTFHKDPVTFESSGTFTLALGADLEGLKKGDAISLKGMNPLIVGHDTGEDNNITATLIERIDYEEKKIWFKAGVINYPADDDRDFSDTGEDGQGFTIEREVPDLEYVLEHDNRLYGTMGNTIYVSKLGDPTNWYFYGTGTAESSYTVDVGTDGEFTGIAAHPTHIVFFKENCIHKLYGYKPANYQLITTECLGLEKGSQKSVLVINGQVYYKSREGIMLYNGDTPTIISRNFGNERYDQASAGTDGMKYYVSMRNKETDEWHLFVLDISRGLWMREDNTHADSFCYLNHDLLYSDHDKKKIMMIVGTGDNIEEEPIEWYAKFGEYDEFVENKKIYSKVEMRLKMEPMSSFQTWISVDGGAWECIHHLETDFKRTVIMPIVPRRCDKFAILITGEGYVRIESLVRVMREGTVG